MFENDGGAGGGFEPRPWGYAGLGNKEMGRGRINQSLIIRSHRRVRLSFPKRPNYTLGFDSVEDNKEGVKHETHE